MVIPEFVDVHPHYSAEGFICTNEKLSLHEKVLRGRGTFDKALAIASGGEVSLFAVLPRIREKMFAVDHSYRSITASFLKVLALQELEPKKLREAFTSYSQLLAYGIFCQYLRFLPEVLQEEFWKRTRSTLIHGASSSPLESSYQWEISVEAWKDISDDQIRHSIPHFKKITFVHGDFLDCAEHGPFDFMYTSNIFDHVGRDGRNPSHDKVFQMLKPKGLMLTTTRGTNAFQHKRAVELHYVNGSWQHRTFMRMD